jgi:hypothetical protein
MVTQKYLEVVMGCTAFTCLMKAAAMEGTELLFQKKRIQIQLWDIPFQM